MQADALRGIHNVELESISMAFVSHAVFLLSDPVGVTFISPFVHYCLLRRASLNGEQRSPLRSLCCRIMGEAGLTSLRHIEARQNNYIGASKSRASVFGVSGFGFKDGNESK